MKNIFEIVDGTLLKCLDKYIAEAIIPDSVTSIGCGAFAGCSSLETIHIPDSVTSIGAYAFHGCPKLNPKQ